MHGSFRFAAAALLILPACALAGPDYGYAQATGVIDGQAEVDGFGAFGSEDAELDGYAGEMSAALGEHAFFRVDYKTLSLKGDVDMDVDRLGMGFGLIRHENEHVDLYGMASLERMDIESEDGDGYSVNLGMRVTPAPWVEINPSLGYVDYGELGDFDVSGMEYALRVVFRVTEAFGIVTGFEGTDFKIDEEGVNDDPDFDLKSQWHLGARLNF